MSKEDMIAFMSQFLTGEGCFQTAAPSFMENHL